MYTAPGDSDFLFLANWYLLSAHDSPSASIVLKQTAGSYHLVYGHILSVRVHCPLKVGYTGAHQEDQGACPIGTSWNQTSNLVQR